MFFCLASFLEDFQAFGSAGSSGERVSLSFRMVSAEGSGFGSWQTVLAVPILLSIPGKSGSNCSGSNSVPAAPCKTLGQEVDWDSQSGDRKQTHLGGYQCWAARVVSSQKRPWNCNFMLRNEVLECHTLLWQGFCMELVLDPNLVTHALGTFQSRNRKTPESAVYATNVHFPMSSNFLGTDRSSLKKMPLQPHECPLSFKNGLSGPLSLRA